MLAYNSESSEENDLQQRQFSSPNGSSYSNNLHENRFLNSLTEPGTGQGGITEDSNEAEFTPPKSVGYSSNSSGYTATKLNSNEKINGKQKNTEEIKYNIRGQHATLRGLNSKVLPLSTDVLRLHNGDMSLDEYIKKSAKNNKTKHNKKPVLKIDESPSKSISSKIVCNFRNMPKTKKCSTDEVST